MNRRSHPHLPGLLAGLFLAASLVLPAKVETLGDNDHRGGHGHLFAEVMWNHCR
jgi:hypothetical protein